MCQVMQIELAQQIGQAELKELMQLEVDEVVVGQIVVWVVEPYPKAADQKVQ